MGSGFGFDDVEDPVPHLMAASDDLLSGLKTARKGAEKREAVQLDRTIKREEWMQKRRRRRLANRRTQNIGEAGR